MSGQSNDGGIELKTLNVLRQSFGTMWKINKSENVRAYFQV